MLSRSSSHRASYTQVRHDDGAIYLYKFPLKQCKGNCRRNWCFLENMRDWLRVCSLPSSPPCAVVFSEKTHRRPGSKYTLFVYLNEARVVWLDAIHFHIHQTLLYVLELLYLSTTLTSEFAKRPVSGSDAAYRNHGGLSMQFTDAHPAEDGEY